MKRLIFDIEGNGLLDTVSQIHCIAAVDPETRQAFDFKPDQLGEGLELLSKADELVAHYGLGYDYGALAKVKGFKVPQHKQKDSYVVAKLMRSAQKDADMRLVKNGKLPGKLHGKHSIEAWGYRLGVPKVGMDIEDWSQWTPYMHERCVGDVWTNVALWDYLKPDTYSQRAIELEHRVAILTRMMEEAGTPFDEKAAAELHVDLLGKQSKIDRELVEEFGFWFEPEKKTLEPIPDDLAAIKHKDHPGDQIARYWTPKRDDPKRGYTAGAPMTKIERVTFNASSRQHCVKQLKKLGWKPQDFTESGEAKLDDDILKDISERFPQAHKIVEFLLLDKRLGQLADGDNAWLKKVGSDGKMHGAYDPMGTVHSRASHFSPNMGQVPATKSPYGKECRSLFGPKGRNGFVQVGADMSGLQLRGLAHYLHPLDGGAYSKIVTEGDVHWSHCQAMGLVGPDEPRDKENGLHEILREKGAKTFGYAYIFGCFPPKSGAIVRDCTTTAKLKNPEWGNVYDKFFSQGQSDKQVGLLVRKSFDERLSLGRLQSKLKRHIKANDGHLIGLDGRLVPCRSEHSALNFALSSAEAILCKQWLVDSYDALIAQGYRWGWNGDFVFMLWVHDEIQVAAKESIAKDVGEILVSTAKTVGEKLGFRVPLASEYKIGQHWADTH